MSVLAVLFAVLAGWLLRGVHDWPAETSLLAIGAGAVAGVPLVIAFVLALVRELR